MSKISGTKTTRAHERPRRRNRERATRFGSQCPGSVLPANEVTLNQATSTTWYHPNESRESSGELASIVVVTPGNTVMVIAKLTKTARHCGHTTFITRSARGIPRSPPSAFAHDGVASRASESPSRTYWSDPRVLAVF
eukprot:Amastigsp_a175419_24.p2 type:complete len:138 gc:universal Amastigsp_a175419_24:1084-671(-)